MRTARRHAVLLCACALTAIAITLLPVRAGAVTTGPIAAFCSIAPQRYLVERVGGDLVSVRVLVGRGQSPHTFEPTPHQMADLAGAEVYLAIGLPFEDRILDGIGRLSAELLVVDTAKHVPRRRVKETHGHDERSRNEAHGLHEAGGPDDHDDDGESADGGLPDPHVWLNPRYAGILARAVCDALVELAPDRAEVFEENLSELLSDLDGLDTELTDALGPLAGESIFVFHPAFGYFTDAYGLTQIPVEIGGMEPSARELVKLVELAAAQNVRVIFVQPQFSSRSASAIAAEIGGAVVRIDPLSGDYEENLRSIANEVREALSEE